jgi:hypothetical protein
VVAKCLSTCGRWLYLPKTQEKTRYKLKNPMDKQVKLVVPICSSERKYISARTIVSYCIFKHQNCQIIIGH